MISGVVVTPSRVRPRAEGEPRHQLEPAPVRTGRCQSKQDGNLLLVSWVPHFTKADIRSYIAGTGSVGADRHVRICPFCAHRVADAATGAAWWERRGVLGRLVRVDVSQVDELLAEIAEEQRHDAA
jgi:hypothetical protein